MGKKCVANGYTEKKATLLPLPLIGRSLLCLILLPPLALWNVHYPKVMNQNWNLIGSYCLLRVNIAPCVALPKSPIIKKNKNKKKEKINDHLKQHSC